jgi:starch-binding outer membrane protein, SusD/RagB family
MQYKCFVLFFFWLSLGSCKKYLEVEPANQRALKTVDDVKASLAGYLKIMKPGESVTYHNSIDDVLFFVPSYWSLFEFYSDNIDFERDYSTYIDAMGPSGKDEAKLILLNNFSIPTSIWVQHYRTIGFLNVLIDALDKANGNDVVKQQLRNEMLVCRSIYYFKLLQYFSPYKDAQAGIPVYTGVQGPFAGLAVPRSTQKEVFDFIISELTEAASSNASPDVNYNIFYNKTYVNNLLAQVYWYKAESAAMEATDYANAKQYATKALEGAVIPETASDYISSMNGTFNGYNAYQRWGGYSSFNELTYGQPWGMTPFLPHASPELLAIFSPDDYRYQAFIQPDGTIIRPLSEWPNSYTAAFNLFRPEEAYLIKIEATLKDNQGGSETDARALLNEFRRKRGIDSDYTGNDLNQEIINERRREFCFHTDMRWLDMKRYGIGTTRNDLQIYNNTYNIVVEPNDFHFALPIPVDEELRLNPEMTPNPSWNEIIF